MRLIDLDAFREEYDLREHCEDCGRRNKKECDYPLYSARDFCGWLDDVPTIAAVPLDKLCEWLSENSIIIPCKSCPNFSNDYCAAIRDTSIPCPKTADDWRRVITKWMEASE